MGNNHKSVIYLGLFIFFLGLALYVNNFDSMILNLQNATDTVKTVFRLAFVIIAFGFLVGVVIND